MKRFKISHYIIGVLNGILFTFAFLFFMVGMNEEFQFVDTEETPEIDSIVHTNLLSYDIEDIEKEFYKRKSPEDIIDNLLHRYSMDGTIWEEKWDSLSDLEKVGLLLHDPELTNEYGRKIRRKAVKKCGCNHGSNVELYNFPQDTTFETKMDSCYILQGQMKLNKISESSGYSDSTSQK